MSQGLFNKKSRHVLKRTFPSKWRWIFCMSPRAESDERKNQDWKTCVVDCFLKNKSTETQSGIDCGWLGRFCFSELIFGEDSGEKLQFFWRIRWILNVCIDIFRNGGLADVCTCGRDKSDKFMFFKEAMRLCSCLNKLHVESAGHGHVGSRKCNAAPIPCAWSRHPCFQPGTSVCVCCWNINIYTYISWDNFLACDVEITWFMSSLTSTFCSSLCIFTLN